MRASSHGRSLSRREFLSSSVAAAGALGLTLAMRRDTSAAEPNSNPFAYDISRFAKTDPKLVLYEQVRVFSCPHGEARGLAAGPDRRLYVANGNYVSVLDYEGGLSSEIALNEPARAVASSPDG